jgi:hypothetical protein
MKLITHNRTLAVAAALVIALPVGLRASASPHIAPTVDRFSPTEAGALCRHQYADDHVGELGACLARADAMVATRK